MSKSSKTKSTNGTTTPRAIFSHEDFVKIWQAAGSVKEVADKLATTRNVVSQRAVKLRKAKVHLKRMSRLPEAIDTAALNKLIGKDAK